MGSLINAALYFSRVWKNRKLLDRQRGTEIDRTGSECLSLLHIENRVEQQETRTELPRWGFPLVLKNASAANVGALISKGARDTKAQYIDK